MLFLTPNGLAITGENGTIIRSTPPFNSHVAVLQLADNGNLILLDKSNGSLWESFDHPTDTIVTRQRLPVGKSLVSSASEHDFKPGNYKLMVTDQDVVLRWNGQTYWKLSMDTKAYKNSNLPASFLVMNGTSLSLLGGGDESVVVIEVILGSSCLKIAKLEASGRLSIKSFVGDEMVQEFAVPIEDYQLPFICGKLGFFSNTTRSASALSTSTGKYCSCPSGFRSRQLQDGDCVPTDESYSLPSGCNLTSIGTRFSSSIKYIQLGSGMDYFANHFKESEGGGVSLSGCQDLCSHNCSCLGVFFESSSGVCYLVENNLGSLMWSSAEVTKTNRVGYIKAVLELEPQNRLDENAKQNFPITAALVPLLGLILLIVLSILGTLWHRRNRVSEGTARSRLSRRDSSFFAPEIISILGAPVRFQYEELAAATENFKTRIGSGGFGVVYTGTLANQSLVAVKKITSSGAKGKKEFYDEIAILGNIHHVNLVRLKGFCVRGKERLLVLEYMNQGSLDHSLFGDGPVLEWQDRFNIALGTARGLEYLHSQCRTKIIHFDIKPENILLHDNLQVKVSDFGLSRLLSTEESELFTTMRGTIGYLAPECLVNSAIKDKTDVYSYGMVLLEIVRGHRNRSLRIQSSSSIENVEEVRLIRTYSNSPAVYFPLLALEMHEERRYVELADPRLEGRVRDEEVEKLVRVALCCVQLQPVLRPSMASVVGMLEGRVPLGEPRVDSLNFLRSIGRGFIGEATRGEQ